MKSKPYLWTGQGRGDGSTSHFRHPRVPLGRSRGSRTLSAAHRGHEDALDAGLGSSTLASSGMLHEAQLQVSRLP